jgi:uncharacterized protein YajQ (UPF0234 family)
MARAFSSSTKSILKALEKMFKVHPGPIEVRLEKQEQKIDEQGKKIDDLQIGLQILRTTQINSCYRRSNKSEPVKICRPGRYIPI